MRICYIASLIELPYRDGYGSGGATHTIEVARHLSALGHDVTVVCTRRSGELMTEKLADFTIVRMFSWDSPLFRAVSQRSPAWAVKLLRGLIVPFVLFRTLVHLGHLTGLAAFRNFDVFYERTSRFTNAGALVSMLFRKPLLVEVNDEQWDDLSLRRSHAIVTPAGCMIPECYRTKVRELNWGVNADLFQPCWQTSAVRKELGIPCGPVVIFVGSGMEWHGLQYILDAAPLTLERYPECRFVIVGGGPQLEGYRARVEQNGLAPSFRFTGAVAYESVPRLIAACDIALAPYTSKLGENERNLFACPMKVLEYMACGVPPIVTRLANSRCLVEDGVDGILIEEDSPAAIADAICYLLDSPERRAALGARARESALRHYSWAQHCRALNELFMSARGIC